MFYHSELQLINTEHSLKACVQFTSRFLDLILGSWAGCIQPQLSLVVWEMALTCDGLPLFAICATLSAVYRAATQDLTTLSISHIVTSDRRSDAIIIVTNFRIPQITRSRCCCTVCIEMHCTDISNAHRWSSN